MFCITFWTTFSVVFFSGYAAAETNSSSIVPVDLRTEYLRYPLTVESINPRFSWKLHAVKPEAQNLTQTAYQILVSSANGSSAGTADLLWDSGVVKSDTTVHIRYAGKPLKSRQLAVWKVKVWDQNGAMAESVTNGQFGMGLLHKSDWKAKWIHASVELHNVAQSLQYDEQTLMSKLPGLVPPLYFRKSFNLEQQPTENNARLFATAKGIYEISINGKKIQTSHFNPGYIDYHKSFRYQSFADIERHLRKGENVIGIVVAPGWYASYWGFQNKFALYGRESLPGTLVHWCSWTLTM